MTPTPEALADGALLDRLARGEAVPGGPGACANPIGCHHAKVWHTPKTGTQPCEIGHRPVTQHLTACGCRDYQRTNTRGGAA